ncbi:hypothetical protein [Desulforhopalus sp. 52FAK]
MEYSVNTNSKVIHAQFRGAVNSDNLINSILTIRSDKYFQDGYNLIVNFREAYPPKGYMEVAQVAEFVKLTSVARATFKMAILVNDAGQTRSAKLYILLTEQENVQIFHSIKTARNWVAQTSESQDGQRVEDYTI